MKQIQCCDPAEVGRLLDLPPTDPRRRHLDECPRCRSLALSYGDFVAPGPVPSGARPSEAASTLSAALSAAMASPLPPALRERRALRFSRWLQGVLTPPALKPALAAAAVVIVAGAVVVGYLSRTPSAPVLRGQAGVALALAPLERGPEGTIRLRWQPLAGAESYQVRLYSTALVEVARLEPTTETTMLVSRDAVPDSLPSGSTVLCRVAGLRGGNDIALSPVGTLRVP
jgi:hypothetical protein